MEDIQNHADKLIQLFGGSGASESAKAVSDRLRRKLLRFFPFPPDCLDRCHFKCCYNPFVIHLVVKNVMKYVLLEDLPSCRRVCTLWNAEAGALFRRQQTVIFYPESRDKMAEFTALMAAEQKCQIHLPPFTSFCFTARFRRTEFPEEMLEHFVNVCGPQVKNLQLFYPSDGLLTPEHFKKFFIQGMPNLETIHFVGLPFSLTQTAFLVEEQLQMPSVVRLKIDGAWESESCWKEAFLRDLLGLMPNLEDYEVWTWNSSQDANSRPYFQTLEGKNTLKVLRAGAVGEDLGCCLTDLRLQLTKLFLPVFNGDLTAKTLETLLLSQRDTLEELELNCSSAQDSRFIQFPWLPRLTTLRLTITYPWENVETPFFPPIDYAKQLPALETFTLELALFVDVEFSNYFFPPKASTVGMNVRELSLSFNGFRDENFIQNLSAIFPGLLRFKLNGYGKRIFSSICIHMPQLEELELNLIYGMNVDDQLTGIPKDLLSTRQSAYNHQIGPSITSLKNLRTLAIKQKDWQGKFVYEYQCITDVTVYLALTHMTTLKHLYIKNIQLSEESRSSLRSSLQDCWLEFL